MTGRVVHVIANDGSPLNISEKTIYGTQNRVGIGGAELALLTLCRAWAFYGNDITLYNNPDDPTGSSFKQRTLDKFNPNDNRDILIIFRSPNERALHAKGKKIWFSCDPYTVGDYQQFAKEVSKIVTISKCHADYFKNTYGIKDTITIDLPVRTWEYNQDIKKRSHNCIFTSVPDRGLDELYGLWPLIAKEVPDASLTITSDWRLWADWQSESAVLPRRLQWAKIPNVEYKAAVNRMELIRIQQEADLHVYPCVFQELFCIAVAESQVAGAFPVTSDCGALGTTNMGRALHGSPHDPKWGEIFVKNVVEMLTDPKLPQAQEWIQQVSRRRFSIENILSQWEAKVFSG